LHLQGRKLLKQKVEILLPETSGKQLLEGECYILSRFKGIIILTAVILTVASLAVGCAGETTDNESGQLILRAGHAVNEEHAYHRGLEKFKSLVEDQTGGAVKIEIYPNASLGDERDMVEGLQLGTVDIVLSSTGPLGNFVPQMNVVDLPFLFRDKDHAYKVLDGEIGQELLQKFEPEGIIGLAFWENGFRHVTNSKRPINTPEDMEGLKLRTMKNRVHVAAFKELGVDATPMAWSEVFTSLQQGTIDGQENPVAIIYSHHLYEVQEYLALTGHVYSPAVLMIAENKMQSLTEAQQEAIREAAVEAGIYERNLISESEKEQIENLEREGMKITRPEREKFMEATVGVYKDFEKEFGPELIQKILETE